MIIIGKLKTKQKRHTFFCSECNNIFVTKKKNLGKLRHDKDGYYYNIECPSCGETLCIDSNVLKSNNSHIRKHLKSIF